MQLFLAGSQVEGRRLPIAIGMVAAGGALGATLRWIVNTLLVVEPATWPWATLTVNIAGCGAIGIAASRVERGSLQWDFGVTGILGGFTTMSSFAVELNDLVDADRSALALGYGLTTLVACACAVAIAWSVSASGGGSGPAAP